MQPEVSRKFAPSRALLVVVAAATPVLLAQSRTEVDFANLIKTPIGVQKALERCDGHPQFETALANWLETAEPSSPAERDAIRKTSLLLLQDTNDRQIVLGLIDGLLRHALEDVKKDPAAAPKDLARALYRDISEAVKSKRSKTRDMDVLAHSLTEDGAVSDKRQAGFIKQFLNLADSRETAASTPATSPVQPSFGAKQTNVSTTRSTLLQQ